MSTFGGFSPPAAPPCPYEPRMTRAEALALRASAGLKENCVVVITDGPTIGAGALTSPTEIELNPVAPDEFGLSARVNTTFDNSAWSGEYDIDLGVAGSIIRLTDNRNNTVIDTDADSPTVHVQFPWGSLVNIRDNFIDDVTLVGWDTLTVAGSAITDNTIRGGATVNLTSTGAGTVNINQSEIGGGTLNLIGSANNASLFQAKLQSAFVIGRSAANFSLTRSFVTGGTLAVPAINHTATGSFSAIDSDIRDSYTILHSGSGTFSANNTRFLSGAIGTVTFRHEGAGNVLVNDQLMLGSGGLQVNVQAGSSGNVSIAGGEWISVGGVGTIVKTAGSTASMTVTGVRMIAGTFTQAAGAILGAFNVNTLIGRNASITQNGPGALSVASATIEGGVITNSATATRGLTISGSSVRGGGVTQNRTGGTGVDNVSNSQLQGGTGATLTLSGAADPGLAQTVTLNTTIQNGALVFMTDPVGSGTGNQVLTGCEVSGQATVLTVPAGALNASGCIFEAGAVVNLGAGFNHNNTIVQGAFNKTFTAANNNRLCNKSFDDTI